jgi:hypothetical protein
MEIPKETLNISQHTGNLPGGNGAYDSVQLLEKARADTEPVLNELGSQLGGTGEAGGTVYSAAVSAARPSADYTARVIPQRSGVAVPLESARILWQR